MPVSLTTPPVCAFGIIACIPVVILPAASPALAPNFKPLLPPTIPLRSLSFPPGIIDTRNATAPLNTVTIPAVIANVFPNDNICPLVSLLTFSCPAANLDSSDTSNPTASANAFLCTTFILLRASVPPTWFLTSANTPSKSPSNANCLALSKLSCLPSKTDASICFSIDDSKSNILSDILSTALRFNPNFLASIAALARFTPPSLANLANNSVLSATSSNTSFGATPAALDILSNVEIIFRLVSKLPPCILCMDLASLAALSPVIPVLNCSKPKFVRVLNDNSFILPNSLAIAFEKAAICSPSPPIRLKAFDRGNVFAAKLADSPTLKPKSRLI